MPRVLYVGGREPSPLDEFETVTADSAAAAAEAVATRDLGCVVVAAERREDLDPVEAVRERDPAVPVVVTSANADGRLAAAATRRGATEYLPRERPGPTLADRVEARLNGGTGGEPATTGGAIDGTESTGTSAPTNGKRYREIIEAVDDGVYALDDKGQFTYVNEALAAMTGYDREELLGEHTRVIKDEATVEKAERTLAALLSGEERETTFELALQPEEGDPIPCEDHMVVLTEDGEFAGTAGVIRDVSERVRRERRLERLLEAAQRFIAAEDPESVAEIVADTTGAALGHERSVVRLYDEDSETLVPVARGSDDPAVTDRPAYPVGEGGPGRAFETGERLRYRTDVERARGDTGASEDAIYLPLGEAGVLTVVTTDPDGFDDAAVSMLEVLASTAAVALERAAREDELERYRTVVENVQDMVYVVDEHQRFSLVTEPLAEWLGYDREELVGMNPRELLGDEEAERFEATIQKLWHDRDTGESRRLETEAVDADGVCRPIEVEVSLYPTGDEFAGTVGVVRDRTELVETRERLETQRNRFQYLFDNLPDAVVEGRLNDEGRPIVRDVNDAFTDVFGYDSDAVKGESLNEFILPEEDREQGRQLDRKAAEGEVTNREVRRRTADGFRDFLFRGIPYERGDDGTHSFGIYTDITTQKERERRLEVLNRVLRHNLRNDLNVVLGYAEMLAEQLEDDELGARAGALREKASELAALSDRARSLDRTMSRGSPRDSTVDLARVVDEVLAQYDDIAIESDLDDVRVVGDARLQIAVEELLENVREHVGSEARVRVSTEGRGREVALRVADDGPGIPADERAVVTGSAEITQLRHGSGLGLWVVKWVCESCGGRLRFDDSDLGGAAVVLALPPARDGGPD
jgi:PAS domain S-box-containing protein